ncbi:beta-ketoacyl-[acyl-carrier-protein] synthase family protein [Krasilnikovia sp. M28-CT-15]|uniref:beta-ketoacyl-[acyl-carrier-protein] synthase family protein n=1 Tax=Krasilnikovia sp. M28-CT-15 TaxID=3373540 RepID=UPI00399D25EB
MNSTHQRPQRTRVVVTGCGVVSPVGHDTASFWAALLAGRSGVRPITRFDAGGLPVRIAGDVADFGPGPYLSRAEARRLDRFAQFAMVAAGEAVAQAKLDLDGPRAERTGVLIGSGYGAGGTLQSALRIIEQQGYDRVSPYVAAVASPDNAAFQVAMRAKACGPSGSVSTACASGTSAIGDAAGMIRSGAVDAMIVGGSDDPINVLDIGAAARAGALALGGDEPEQASRPFDRQRTGFVMGAGAAVVVLESAQHARDRGAPILAEVAGYGATTDVHHLTAPHPEGLGARRAMHLALADAGAAPEEIDHVYAHGTGTKLNDTMESASLRAVLGPHALRTPISAIKSMTGHTIGAAGAMQAVAAVRSMQTGLVPPTINCTDPEDPELDYVAGAARARTVHTVLSNSFGFGGHNAVLVLRRWQD